MNKPYGFIAKSCLCFLFKMTRFKIIKDNNQACCLSPLFANTPNEQTFGYDTDGPRVGSMFVSIATRDPLISNKPRNFWTQETEGVPLAPSGYELPKAKRSKRNRNYRKSELTTQGDERSRSRGRPDLCAHSSLEVGTVRLLFVMQESHTPASSGVSELTDKTKEQLAEAKHGWRLRALAGEVGSRQRSTQPVPPGSRGPWFPLGVRPSLLLSPLAWHSLCSPQHTTERGGPGPKAA